MARFEFTVPTLAPPLDQRVRLDTAADNSGTSVTDVLVGGRVADPAQGFDLRGVATFLGPDGVDTLYLKALNYRGKVIGASIELDGVASGGGSVPSLWLLGDGSDGAITVDADVFDWPDPSGVPAWATSTVYAEGDVVSFVGGDTGLTRLWRCTVPGTSDVAAFADGAPGLNVRGFPANEDNAQTDPAPLWEQATAICQGQLEGPIFATDVTVAAGVTLNVHGWPIFYTGTATIPATAVFNASGADAVAADPSPPAWQAAFSTAGSGLFVAGLTDYVGTLLGRGVPGVAGGNGQPADSGKVGLTWGGGMGGRGGTGGDGPGGHGGWASSTGPAGFRLARKMLQTVFSPFFFGLNRGADEQGQFNSIGMSGGPGGDDIGGSGAVGGASGNAGSGFALIGKTLVLGGTINCKGGNGGDGGAAGPTGGGGGSSGGCCVLVYQTRTGTGTVDVSGGLGGAPGGAGTAGQAGSAGDFVEFTV